MTEPGAEGGTRVAAWWLIHPLLVGAFPLVFLFAQNVNHHLSLDPLWVPLGAVVGVATVVLLVALGIGWVVGIGAARSALAASLVIGLAMTYGHAWGLVGETLRLHRYLLLVWAGIAVLGLVLILAARPSIVARATTALTAVAAGLIAVNLAPIAGLALPAVVPEARPVASADGAATDRPRVERDVWYIVLDRYAGNHALRATYGFDNSEFLAALGERGFEVAEDATANYLKTATSLLSSLNMDELDHAALGAEAAAGGDWRPIYRRLHESHAVERYLHAHGYSYVHVGSLRGPTQKNVAADVTYEYRRTTEFAAVFVDTTILAAFERVAPLSLPTGVEAFLPAQTEFQLRVLDDLADAPGRNFVFAHLMVPHPPYTFNADGSRVTDAQADARTEEEQYVEQLRFTNASMLALVDRLHAGPPESWPIIVIASDEGPFPDRYDADENGFQWLEATDEELLRKFSILLAVSVPGVDRAGLEAAGFSDDLTPLNLFRVVFNAAFDDDLPILPQRNWVFVDQEHLYDSVEVTDRVAAVISSARSGAALP